MTLKVNSIEGPTTVKLVNCRVDNIITLGKPKHTSISYMVGFNKSK